MRRIVVAAGLLALGCSQATPTAPTPPGAEPAVAPGPPPAHPLKGATVGDWAEYHVVSKGAGPMATATHRRTVVRATADEVAVRTEFVGFTAKDGRPATAESTYPLADPYRPAVAVDAVSLTLPGKTRYKDLGSGAEPLTVAHKTYDTTWTEYDLSGPASLGGTEGELPPGARAKVWLAAGVPAGGLVKAEFRAGVLVTVIELLAHGKGDGKPPGPPAPPKAGRGQGPGQGGEAGPAPPR